MATKIVNAGLAILTARIKNTGQAEPVQASWGTGAGTTAVADTSLFTEAANNSGTTTRIAGTSSQVTTTVTNDTYQVTATLTCGSGTGAITVTNAGLFDNNTIGSGSLCLKGDFTGIALSVGDSIAFTFKIVASSA